MAMRFHKLYGLVLALGMISHVVLATVPDLTNGDAPTGSAVLTLGPTGLRGWLYYSADDTSLSRQILVTSVDEGSPADGIIAIDDVILGADGTGAAPAYFGSDARRAYAQAITDAEARSPAELKVLRWRSGTVTTETLTLQTLGAYTATAPYNCPKSAKILERSLACLMAKENAGKFNSNVLALLAANDAAIPGDNAARQMQAAAWARQLILPREQIDRIQSNALLTESKVSWSYGWRLIVLAEYLRQTGDPDPDIFDSVEAYAVAIANGMSVFGTLGHQFTPPDFYDGSLNGPYSFGYGAINQTGLTCLLGLGIAKLCGVDDPRVLAAQERAGNTFASFARLGGTVGYGEHLPSLDIPENNGVNSLAALALNLIPGYEASSKTFAYMATAGARTFGIGHTGSYFAKIWQPLGANLVGEEAAAVHFKGISWRLDLCRRWDGGFDINDLYQGTAYSGKAQWYEFWATTHAVLTYATPYRKLYITGASQNPDNFLTASEVASADFAEDYDAMTRSSEDLIADLEHDLMFISYAAAKEIGARTSEHSYFLPLLLAKAVDGGEPENGRMGACLAIGEVGDAKTGPGSSVSVLSALLTNSSFKVRFAAGQGLRYIPDSARLTEVSTICAAAVSTAKPVFPLDAEDPMQFAHYQICFNLFYSGNAVGPMGVICGDRIYTRSIARADYIPAIRAVAGTALGYARSTLALTFQSLNQADLEALAGTVVDTVRYVAPGDNMFAPGVRKAGLDVLKAYDVAEGVPLARLLSLEGGISQDAVGTLIAYAGSCNLVTPNPTVEDYLRWVIHNNWKDQAANAQLALDAIAADTTPTQVTAFKVVTSVTAGNPSLTLPDKWTTLKVASYDHAKGGSIYTWRKVHGAGGVTFANNGTAAGNDTIVLFDGIPGQYLFEVTMSDSRGLTEDYGTVAVTLGPVPSNDPPTADLQDIPVAQATATPITLTGSDPEGYPLVFAVITRPANGILTGTAPHLVYTPRFSYIGEDSFTFEVMDSEGQKDSATIRITVEASTVGVAVYEPFDYPTGALLGQAGTTEVGLDGTWRAQAAVSTVTNGSMSFGELVAAGGRFDATAGASWGGSRAVSPSALAGNKLLDDGATVWIAAVVGIGPTANYIESRIDLALANNGFGEWSSQRWIVNDGSQPGSGIGFTMGYLDGRKGCVKAAQYRDQSLAVNYDASIYGSWEDHGAVVLQGGKKLIVCRVTWGSDPQEADRIEVFQPLIDDLNLPAEPISVLDALVDQSTFDTLTFNIKSYVLMDEIRIGPTYHSVVAGAGAMTADTTPPSPDPMAFEVAPKAVSDTCITMMALPAHDSGGVEYYFACAAGGGNDSGWQSGRSYTDSGLTPGGQYSYTVVARDLSPARNTNTASAAVSVILPMQFTVPDVVGMSRVSAGGIISNDHCVVGSVTTLYDPVVPEGNVISQNPAGGSLVAPGTSVDLVVSLGRFNTVPEVGAGTNQVVFLSQAVIPWTPEVVPTVAWFDASDGSTVENVDGAVRQWNDKSGNGNNAVQGLAGSRPFYDQANGEVDFDGSDIMSVSNDAFRDLQNFCAVTVQRWDSPVTWGNVSVSYHGEAGIGWQMRQNNSPVDKFTFTRRGTDGVDDPAAASLSTTNVFISAGFRVSSSQVVIRGNGADIFSGPDTGSIFYTGAGRSAIGGRYQADNSTSPAGYLRGSIKEIIVVDQASTDQVVTMEGYLAHKWGLTTGLPTNHPHKTAAPLTSGFQATATLAGEVTDADGDPCVTLWRFVSSEPASLNPPVFADASALTTTVTFSRAGMYTFQLTATDTMGASNQATVVITVADTGTGGVITPGGAVFVIDGADKAFVVTPDRHYSIGSVKTNGANVTVDNREGFTYVWSNITASGTIDAAFERRVTNDKMIPTEWLELAVPGSTNDYEAAVMQDQDGDGFATWQEYWAGTDPQDSNSYLRIDSVTFEGGNIVIKWESAAVWAGVPPLGIQARTSLTSGSWSNVGQKSLANGVNAWSNSAAQQLYYRLAVTNAP
jgi:hypothetical protein